MSDTETPTEGAGQITERGQRALSVLRRLLELSRVESEVELIETEERIRLEVFPTLEDDAPLLIGRAGHTLLAYQFITNRIVNRFPENRKPISIDVAGYGARRRNRLESMAQRLCQEVDEHNVELSVLGMNPADRRTLHMALREQTSIRTLSCDEGIARRIILTPLQD